MNLCHHARRASLVLIAIVVMILDSPGLVRGSEAVSVIRGLFLGDNGHHRPAERFKGIQPLLAARGIELDYTDDLRDLSSAKLAGYDCLVLYANHTRISEAHEAALLEFVRAGGGFIPLHCASYCFLNSSRFVELVGAQFKSHGTGVFAETIVTPEHSIMKGLEPIRSWDETYVHTRHNTNRIVLAQRQDESGVEPWTWVREEGRGRVFYTAWGHDERTWSNAGFQELVERGIRWASANSPTRLEPQRDLPPFETVEAPAPLPNYVANARWGTQGEPIRTMQKPLDPPLSQRHFVTFPEFDIRLFASEPDIVKPIWLSWDDRGRLWIAETVDYPNELQAEGEGHDRLKICEDTDGDGRADRFTVFADRLSVPTSFVFARGGVIVIHSGRTEFLRDTDGDDRADERRILFEGWGTEDTHATASNLRYGFDNWIWGVVGYSGFRGTVGGKEHRFGQGIFRFKPDGSQLEFIRSSNNNTWGLGFSEEGFVFGSTANGNASMYMPIPNRFYEALSGWSASRLETIADSQRFYPLTAQVRQVDYHGRYTAGAGSALYTARDFPRCYWNRVQFVAEPTGHLLGKFHLEARGADYIAHNGRSFLASDDEWSSPIAAEVGPDGALWVSDWYNYIIQHNPTPQGFRTGKGNAYATPLRDKSHGRIYRVVHREGRHSLPATLDRERPETLLAALGSDNLLWRLHAQRALIEAGRTEVIPALCAIIRDETVDSLGLNPGAIHALWTLQGLGALEKDEGPATVAAVEALKHPSAAVRRTAITVLPRTATGVSAAFDAKLLTDADAQVRLATLLALSEMPSTERVGSAVFGFLQDPSNSEDRWLADAAATAAARNDAAFLKAASAGYRPVHSDGTPRTGTNLLSNASFEDLSDGRPVGWRTMNHGGRAQFTVDNVGHSGSHSVRISATGGADSSWSMTVPVEPRTEYRLSAWIKTEGLEKRGALGALLNIHELQDPENGATRPIDGTRDWTPVQLTFNSGELQQLTVNCLFGGWGRATGTAWFDDVELVAASVGKLSGPVGRVVRLVTTHYARRGPVDSIVSTIGSLQGAPAGMIEAALDGLAAGWPEDVKPSFSSRDQEALASLMSQMPESGRDRLVSLANRWGLPDLFAAEVSKITAQLRRRLLDARASDNERAEAARRLIGLDPSEGTVSLILDQVQVLTPPGLASALVNALTEGSAGAATASSLVEHWNRFSPAVRRAAISVLMRRGEWTKTLLDAVGSGKVARADVAVEQWSQLKQNPNRELAQQADQLSGTVGPISADRQEIVERLLPLSAEKGDVARGREVFVANCAVCHVFNGEGGRVGPDLSGIAARARADILTEILDPNRSVEANYRLWHVTTKDGETLSGRLEAETQTTIEILDTTGQKHVVQRSSIEELSGSPLSIMPAGFEVLPSDDLKGLLEYLAAPRG